MPESVPYSSLYVVDTFLKKVLDFFYVIEV